MKKLFVLFPLVLILAACGAESDVKKAVIATLIDPDSVKFGETTLIGEDAACITVNAKNTMGGYTGNKELYLRKMNNAWIVGNTSDVSHEDCVEAAKKVLADEKKDDKEHSRQSSKDEPKILKLGTYTANLQHEDGDQYIQTDIRLKVNSNDIEEKIMEHQPEIQSKINALLASKKASEISTPEGKVQLSNDIKAQVEFVLGIRKIDPTTIASASSIAADSVVNSGLGDVLFTSFIIQ